MNDFRALVLCNLAVLILVGLPLSVDPTFGQSYKVSEEKQKLIGRLRKGLCLATSDNDFPRVKEILKNAGKRYLGDEITVEEAYPHIYCNEMMASNIDLIRVAAEYPHLDMFFVDFVYHFTEGVRDKTMFAKLPMCKRDFGNGCLDVFEHIEKNRRGRLNNAVVTRKFDFLKKYLYMKLGQIGGPIRDPEFCRKVLGEPHYCHTEKLDMCVAANATRYDDCHRKAGYDDCKKIPALNVLGGARLEEVRPEDLNRAQRGGLHKYNNEKRGCMLEAAQRYASCLESIETCR